MAEAQAMKVYGPCWLFEGAKTSGGYGNVRIGGRAGRNFVTHRLAYEILVGPVPEGLDLDHLCRNRACYNPAHLDPVTRRENLRRGDHANRDKSTCPQGHRYDQVRSNGERRCSQCRNAQNRASYERKKRGEK